MTRSKSQPRRFPGHLPRLFDARPTAIAAACALLTTAVHAIEIDTGNPDLSVRWDNTVRLNYGLRVESRDSKIGNSVLADEGDYRFDNGDEVAKRIDLLSEFDLVYQKRYGMRVSAAGWYDGAYNGSSRTNPNPPFTNIPSYVNKQYTSRTRLLYEGPDAEFLDAFVFGGVDIGTTPVNAKFGRHSLYWGESLLLGGNLHSVAYAQNPLDLQKGFATPGTEAKELFRPNNQISVQSQVTDTISLAGYYMLEWAPARFPEGGTYLGPVDFVFRGPQRQFLSGALGFASNGGDVDPHTSGQFGVSARWSPDWLEGGNTGLYYRRFADRLPQVLLTRAGPNVSQYSLIYPENINLYGASITKNIFGVSTSAEVSYRQNTPLFSQVLGVAPGLPPTGDTKGARGDTWHAVVNAVGTIAKTPLFDSASWLTELSFAGYTKVNSGANLFNAIGYAPCNATAAAPAKDKWDGCVTRNYAGIGLTFTPNWYQVYPGVDLSTPLTYAIGIHGNAPTVFGGNQGLGNYSLGVSADVLQKYRFDLKYIDFVGHYRDNGTAVTSVNGLNTYLRDRGFLSLTFKTTF